jgi:hypothetical protein
MIFGCLYKIVVDFFEPPSDFSISFASTCNHILYLLLRIIKYFVESRTLDSISLVKITNEILSC